MPSAGSSNHLLTTAQGYRDLGWSVIPLRGKVAAVPWKAFQQRKPDPDLLKTWFNQPGITGIGLITGWISGLIVLDFDTPEAYHAFQLHAPGLARTRTVRTKRGWHLYYQLPPTVNIASQSLPGLDIQSHGKYVVTPPSIVDGHTYALDGKNPFRTLGQGDLAVLHAFTETFPVGAHGGAPTSNGASVLNPNTPLTTHTPPILTPNNLIGLYRHLAARGGRNNALFQAGCLARDHGWPQHQARQTLAGIYIHQSSPPNHHHHETPQGREREATATLNSAYSRPPRPASPLKLVTGQLPNSVREAFLNHKMTYAIRVIEALRLNGIHPGQIFTRPQAIRLLRGVVGRNSVDNAFNTFLGDLALFTPVSPPAPPQVLKKTAICDGWIEQKKCASVGDKKQGIILSEPFLNTCDPSNPNRAGRKTHEFIMPTNTDLCALLGVTDSGGDSLTLDDLKTAPETRKAIHRELIRRRPGTYTRPWLADRLGVSLVTLDTYNRDIPINVTHSFTREQIGWHNLETVQEEKINPAVFLTDENGKQYPALRVIATKLLKKKHTVYLLAQQPNFYSYVEIPPVPPASTTQQISLEHPRTMLPPLIHERLPKTPPIPARNEHNARPDTVQPPLPGVPIPPKFPANTPSGTPEAPRPKRKRRLSYRQLRKPLKSEHDEQLANEIHTMTKGMSLVNARKLIDTYGAGPVGKGLANLR
ncbi:MAG: bifunctional DNA primase/polymerase, partial [Anaerolineaceae bacterium]|nr:bifunctional DNA primase/polymerase [Anaerolineaceae bacterium]